MQTMIRIQKSCFKIKKKTQVDEKIVRGQGGRFLSILFIQFLSANNTPLYRI